MQTAAHSTRQAL